LAAAASQASADTVLITGANSGIGLEFAKEYAEKGWTVIATYRHESPPESLRPLIAKYPKVRGETLAVTSRAQVQALKKKLGALPIDVLINNAGLYQYAGTYDNQRFGQLDYDIFDLFMDTNVKGPMMVTEALIDNVRAGKQKKIISISSSHGMVT